MLYILSRRLYIPPPDARVSSHCSILCLPDIISYPYVILSLYSYFFCLLYCMKVYVSFQGFLFALTLLSNLVCRCSPPRFSRGGNKRRSAAVEVILNGSVDWQRCAPHEHVSNMWPTQTLHLIPPEIIHSICFTIIFRDICLHS